MAYNIKMKKGTEAAFHKIATPDLNTMYVCTDSGNIYIGDKLYTGKVSYSKPATGVAGIVYIDTAAGNAYSWNGSAYVPFVKNMVAATSSAAGKAGLVPAPGAGKQTSYLRGDGTWAVPTNTTYGNMTGATSSAAGKAGLVPAPGSGKHTSFLRGDGTWVVPTNTTYSNMVGATAEAAGKAGLVPAPAAGQNGKFLRGDGTWQTPYTHPGATARAAGLYKVTVNSTGHVTEAAAVTKTDITNLGIPGTDTKYSAFKAATADASGGTGLVPAPSAGKQTSFLRGDGTWVVPTNTTYGAAGANLGLVKTGGDVTIADGIITVKDDSHAHTISNVDGLQAALDARMPVKTLTNENLDDIKTPGYYSAGGGNTVKGKPANVDAFGLFVYKTAGGYSTQELMEGNTNPRVKYLRQFSGSTWSAFVPQPTFDKAPTSGQIIVADGTLGRLKSSGFTIAKSVPADAVFTDTKYSHPTSAGNKHIPAGGSSGQILRWSADGTAVWGNDNNTTYTAMGGATSSAAGKTGLVPAPAAGKQTSFLRGDGTWVVPTDTKYSNMTAATAEAAGKAGLVPAPGAGKQGMYLRGDGTWATPTNTTYGAAGSSLGLVKSGGDVTIADGVITVKDDSHAHTIANVDNLQATLNKIVRLLSVKLTAAGWTGSAAPFSQTVNVSGISVDDNPMLVSMLDSAATAATQKSYNETFAIVSSGTGTTANGSVTFKVYEKPKTDITVGLKGY